MARANNLTMCSFCGKSQAEVRKLIAGPGVYICDSCITICRGILEKEFKDESRKTKTTFRVPKPAEIKKLLDQHVIGQDTAKKVLSVAVHNHYKRLNQPPPGIGRLPVVASLDELSEDQLVQVLTEPKNAMVKQYTKLIGMDGVLLNMTKDALRALAAEAIRKGTGARALRSMIERIMLDVMFDCPSRDDIAEVTINRAVVEGKKSPLLRRKQEKDAA